MVAPSPFACFVEQPLADERRGGHGPSRDRRAGCLAPSSQAGPKNTGPAFSRRVRLQLVEWTVLDETWEPLCEERGSGETPTTLGACADPRRALSNTSTGFSDSSSGGSSSSNARRRQHRQQQQQLQQHHRQQLSAAVVARLSCASEPWISRCSSWLDSAEDDALHCAAAATPRPAVKATLAAPPQLRLPPIVPILVPLYRCFDGDIPSRSERGA